MATQKAKKKIKFTESGKKELQEIISLVSRNLDDAVSLIEVSDNEKIAVLFNERKK